MCFTDGKKSKRHDVEVLQPSRPLAPVYKADRWEKPRPAPVVPPNAQERKKSEAQVKQALRDSRKVESNRNKKRFGTSNSDADKIRDRALAKAKENKARAPLPPPPVARPVVDDEDSSAYPAPLNIKKKTPQQQQRRVTRTELGNTAPALRRSAAKQVDQSHIHPALRTAARPAEQIHPALRSASSSRPTYHGQSHIHPALRDRDTVWPAPKIHPALRNLPATPARPRRVSDQSQSSVERDIYSYLENPLNYVNSPQESDVSPVNVAQKLPYSSSRKRR